MVLSVDHARVVRKLELVETEHLGEAANERPIDGLDLKAGVLKRILDVGLV